MDGPSYRGEEPSAPAACVHIPFVLAGLAERPAQQVKCGYRDVARCGRVVGTLSSGEQAPAQSKRAIGGVTRETCFEAT
jgi:hypothetical protein